MPQNRLDLAYVPQFVSGNPSLSDYSLILLNYAWPQWWTIAIRHAAQTILTDGAACRFQAHVLDSGWPEGVLKTQLLSIGDYDSIPADTLSFLSQHGISSTKIDDQSTTDVEKAIIALGGKDAGQILILGAFGGRLDHVLYQLGLVYKYPNIHLHGEGNLAILLPANSKTTLKVPLIEHETVGFFSLRGEGVQVTSKGLRWELDGYTLGYGEDQVQSTCNRAEQTEIELFSTHSLIVIVTHKRQFW
ncbi:Thiamine diphosphokinase [Giardia muris]|uniref:Thiamine diphosphokinase n=1 Tax=Giardia muris TaxID=5742 RepID=A0A4Z1T9K5_GIAMU|nr:Thiamine diphosphokinase [Giardia muris]|eukprot:TNJ29837.1 Thiamine diphosphokinase [Giardia muris]